MADYRNSSGIIVDDGPSGATLTLKDSSRVDPWIVRQVSAPPLTVPSGSPNSADATDRPAADPLGATAPLPTVPRGSRHDPQHLEEPDR